MSDLDVDPNDPRSFPSPQKPRAGAPQEASDTSLAEVVATGDRRKSLEAIRDTLAERFVTTRSAVALAPIAKQLTEVIREIDSIPGEREDSASDDLAKRRRARRSAAWGAEAAGK